MRLMSKFIVLASMVLGSVQVTHADTINLQWSANLGFYLEDDTTGLLEVPGQQSGMIQLVYTPVFYANYLDVPAAGPGGTLAPGELLVDEFVLTSGGNSDDFGTFVRDSTGTTPSSGWLYARLYEGGADTAGNIVPGTWYYQSQLFATVDNNVPASPTIQNIQGNNPSSAFPGADFVNRTVVVPEPGSLALLAAGGLLLAWRRRLRA